MIDIMSIRELRVGEYDECYAIVRYLKYKTPGLTQLDVLSPSTALFDKYKALRDAGNWNKQSFEEIYLPQFLREMRYNTEAANALNELYLKSRAGKRIALVCFCDDESLCHRSVVGGMLQGAGAQVNMKSGKNYGAYYKMYLAA